MLKDGLDFSQDKRTTGTHPVTYCHGCSTQRNGLIGWHFLSFEKHKALLKTSILTFIFSSLVLVFTIRPTKLTEE